MQTAWPKTWRWSAQEFDEATGLGWFRGERVELIEGRIVRMPPQLEPHVVGLLLAQSAMRRIFATGFTIRPACPIRLGKRSKPEPDIAVVLGDERDSLRSGAPASPLLVIEISDSTLAYDRGKKAALYARNRIEDYWIVNVADVQVEIHRNPVRDPTHKHGYRYSSIQIHRPPDAISALAAPQARIPVAELLP